MSKFSKYKGKKPMPAISTASLPDIIFMLLFFFMVVTVLRQSDLMVRVNTPSATELTKLEEKTLVNYIYVGKPSPQYTDLYGTAPQIQLGDKIKKEDDIPFFLVDFRSNIPENQHGKITTSLRVDGDVTMGIVTDVKTQLRKANQLRVNYSTKKRGDDDL